MANLSTTPKDLRAGSRIKLEYSWAQFFYSPDSPNDGTINIKQVFSVENNEPKPRQIDLTTPPLQKYNKGMYPPTVVSSRDLFETRTYGWHGLRGYDFAGLAAILNQGLIPSLNQTDHAVCLSVSPLNHPPLEKYTPSSFNQYSMANGISLAVNLEEFIPPKNYASFEDEIRVNTTIHPHRICAILIPENNTPLSEIRTSHESRKPEQMIKFINRTINHLQDLGSNLSLIEPSLIEQVRQKKGNIDEHINSTLETQILACYSEIAKKKLGISKPTVTDILNFILENNEHHVPIAYHTEDQKQAFQRGLSAVDQSWMSALYE